MNRIFTYAATAVLIMAAASCNNSHTTPKSTQTSGITTIACDATFENILSQEIDVFEYIYPKASVMPYYVEESAAIDSLLNESVQMAVTTRMLTQQEVDYLKGHHRNVRQTQIAVDAIALIVNPSNPMEIIDRQELVDILTGKLTEWDKVVVDKSGLGKISVVFDHQGSSTARYMRDSLLNGQPFAENVYAQKSPQAVFEAVASNKNAIGVIGVSWITDDMRSRSLSAEEMTAAVKEGMDTIATDFNSDIKVLKVRRDGEVTAYKPYQQYIFDGLYPFYRQVYLVSIGVNGSLAHGFYSFVTGFEGQKIMASTGILPKVLHPRMAEVN